MDRLHRWYTQYTVPQTRRAAWIIVVLIISIIYSTLGIIRSAVIILRSYQCLHIAVIMLTGIYIVMATYHLFQQKKKQLRHIILSVIMGSIFGYIYFSLNIPEEKIHLVEYGILGHFVYHACAFDIKNRWLLFFTSLCIISVLGYIDEGIQYFLPNRVYQFHDVLLNMLGGGLLISYYTVAGIHHSRSRKSLSTHNTQERVR